MEEPGSGPALASGLLGLAGREPALAPISAALADWAFQRRPLRPEQASAAAANPGPPPPRRALAAALAPLLAPPEDARERDARQAMRELLDAGEAGLAARHLLPRLRTPAGPAWLALAWEGLLRLGSAELPQGMLEATPLPGPLAPLAQRLKAEWAALYLPTESALREVELVCPEHFGSWREYLLAELELRLGQARGRERLARLWRAMPWHPQLTLKLHTLGRPAPATPSDFSGVAVLLYSWNKAELLERTLEDLLRSDLRRACVRFLDNGSTDAMPEVAARMAPRFGLDERGEPRFRAVRLPVNVGAPAARNWLLSLPEVRARRWAAFLDDDVELPGHWLEALVSSAEERERAGEPVDVVGCRITSATPPRTVQSADYHLLPPNDSVKTFVNYPEKIMVNENCANDFDLGLFSYDRPATSVSGCCHLLSIAGVERAGAFDIRFSPTQFDDLERDLRLGVAGLRVHYAGSLAIRHMQHSSLARAQSLTSIGHVFGNKIKLEGKYSLEEIRGLQQAMHRRLEADLRAREEELLATLE
jgi:GT2 family glycosyltransferase